MHPYATDSSERKNVTVFLGLLSVAAAYGLHLLIGRIGLQFPWWVDPPSVMGIFALLYEVFDRWLWKMPLLRKIGVVKVPNLNGEWDLEGESSFNSGKRFDGKMQITQTWTHIRIVVETLSSRSHSLTASLLIGQVEGPTLSYEYLNEPKPAATKTMHAHRGTAVLRLKDQGSLEGEYYSGRDRQNYGSLMLRRIGNAR